VTTHAEQEVAPQQRGNWTVEDASALYMIDRWGAGYFDVNARGDLTVSPLQERGIAIPIIDALRQAQALNLHSPILIRFQDLLRHRVEMLNNAFNRAIAENNYRGVYRGVFPIKVNQLREVVEEILDAGRPFNYGLEVGSKPEVYAGLAVHTDPESLIVCNGYKDSAYIRMAMLGRKLGKKVIVIAEKVSEIRAIMKIAAEMNVDPWIGMRVRLLSKGSGKWATSGGEHAKFGLSTEEILDAIEMLREAKMESAFKLLHFHIGSQIPDILTIKRAVREAAMYYAKLFKAGHPLEYLDVGGGLAIDYDGSRSTFHSSMNYSVEEYATDIVYNIMDVCDDEKVPHPNIVSESGRAIVAHHSVLVVQAFGSIEKTPLEPRIIQTADHKLVREILDVDQTLSEARVNESWHDLEQITHDAVVRDLEDRRFLVLVDRHDRARVAHPRDVLDRTRDSARDVELGTHLPPRLPDLIAVRAPAIVRHGARRAHGRVPERRREILDELEVFGTLDPASAAHDHRRIPDVELRASASDHLLHHEPRCRRIDRRLRALDSRLARCLDRGARARAQRHDRGRAGELSG